MLLKKNKGLFFFYAIIIIEVGFVNNFKLTVKNNLEINQGIKYIVKNDATLTLQEEIDLLFDGSGFYDDSCTSLLANTKVSFEKNGNVLIGNNPLLYSMIFNALVSDITEEGIYNRAIFIVTEKSPYTVGLEAELLKLTQLEEKDYKDTALYDWIHNKSYVK